MYLIAGLSFVLNLLSGTTEALLIILLVQFLIPGIFADSIYWWHANRMIRRAEQKFADPLDQISWLRKRGGTSSFWLILLAVSPVIYIMLGPFLAL